jgi:pimeloyl-ACP methyl ester carboxylesterase
MEKSHDSLHVVHQAAIARLSNRGRAQVITGAGHHIQLQKPQAVIDAVGEVVRTARQR